jgi:trigger factor
MLGGFFLSKDNVRVAGVEKLEPNKVKITFSVGQERFEQAIAEVYEENKKQLRVPGFRAGKAPRKLVEARFGKDFFYEDAVNHMLPEVYEEVLDESGVDAVSRPKFDIINIDAKNGAEFSTEVWTKPAASVSSYTGLEYPRIEISVSDKEVEREISMELEKNARYIPLEEKGLENGNIAHIDFEGFVDGEPFDGGKAEDYELPVGSGRLIPGFEENMLGMTVGETRMIDVTFPEEYHAEHLKGKPAQFKVTLNEAYIKEVPEADDDFAQNVSEFDTIAEYREDIKEKLLERRGHEAEHEKEEYVVEELVKRTTVDIDRKSTRLNSSHGVQSRFPASA